MIKIIKLKTIIVMSSIYLIAGIGLYSVVSDNLERTPITQEYFNNALLGTLFFVFLSSFGYYTYTIKNIKDEVRKNNDKLNKDFSETFKELNFENKELENELKKMRNIFDEYIIYSKSDLFGTITEASSAFCELSGYSKTELLGSPHSIVRHKDTPAYLFKGMWGTLSKDKVWIGDIKNKKKEGDFYWAHTIIAPNYDETGAKVGYISIRQDITDKMEEILKNDLKITEVI